MDVQVEQVEVASDVSYGLCGALLYTDDTIGRL
jgi:hypothetical protein